MALVTTFVSSPLTAYFYPVWYQKKVESWRRGEIDWDTGKPLDGSETPRSSVHYEKLAAEKIKRLTVYLRLDSMPNLLAFTSLFGGNADAPAPKIHPSKAISTTTKTTGDSSVVEVNGPNRPVEAYGLRLLNLTDRGSSVMSVSDLESYTAYDPVVNTFRTFGRLHNLAVSGEVLVVPEASFAETLSMRASDSDFLLLPWSETGGMSEQAIIEDKSEMRKNKLAASGYTSFVHEALEQSVVPVAVLINKNFGGSKNKDRRGGNMRLTRTVSSVSLHSSRDKDVTAPIADRSHHIFFPFFGDRDDRAALRLVLQIAENPQVTASIVHFESSGSTAETSTSATTVVTGGKAGESTIITTTLEQDAAFFSSLRSSLPAEMSNRVVFETVSSTSPLSDVIDRARREVGQAPKNAGDLVVLGRNISRNDLLGREDASDEIRSSNAAANTLGVLAEKVWEGKVGASVLVVKAAY
jgi:hypothetical protein